MQSLSPWLQYGLPAFVGAQRVLELAWSRRNERAADSSASGGALAESRAAFGAMVVAHAGLVVLPPLEAEFLVPLDAPWLRAAALGVFVLAQALRYWAIRSLGTAWNVRARVTPELGVSTRGPYRFVRHPNYLAVVLEFVAVPLALGSWRSALLLNAFHAPVLALRIRREEALLFQVPGYAAVMRAKGRLLPRLRGRGTEAGA